MKRYVSTFRNEIAAEIDITQLQTLDNKRKKLTAHSP